MPQVSVRDHALWFSHIVGGEDLVQRLDALQAGEIVTLEVDGVMGQWVRMKDRRDGRQTRGLKPVEPAVKSHWHELQSERGKVVSIRLLGGKSVESPDRPLESPVQIDQQEEVLGPSNSFSETHPFAYHTFPLHAAKEIWQRGELLSKGQLEQEGVPLKRKTMWQVDVLLGFGDYVHFYLPKAKDSFSFADLPILHTQLKSSKIPPFPHVLLEVPTSILREEDCTICNWNIAVSRPGVPSQEVKGGNWTRGTDPQKILGVWRQFKQENPIAKRARGFWCEGFEVPVLVGEEIGENLSFLDSAPSHCGVPPKS